MRRNIKTKYGWVTLNAEDLGSRRILAILPRQQPAYSNEQKDFRKKLPDGAVLISRHEEGEDGDRRFYQIYKQGIYPALRSRQIIQRQYGNGYRSGERAAIHLNINSARLHLETLLRYKGLSQKERRELGQCLADLASLLENKRNVLKEIAHDYIELSSDPEDSIGRTNPGVCRNQLATGTRYLNFRLLEIPNIEKYIQRDEIMLMMERDRHLVSCQELYWRLRQIMERPALKKATKNRNPKNMEFDLWMMSRVREVGAWRVGPFTKTRWNVINDFNEAREVALQGNYYAVSRIFDRIIRSLRFKIAQFWLEDVIAKVSLVVHGLERTNNPAVDQFSINRAGDLGEEMKTLRQRLQTVLNDSGFRRRSKARLIQCLDNAERCLGEWKWSEAKALLDEATAII